MLIEFCFSFIFVTFDIIVIGFVVRLAPVTDKRTYVQHSQCIRLEHSFPRNDKRGSRIIGNGATVKVR